MSKKVYEIITSLIVEKLEAGVVPWHMPWRSSEGLAQKNHITGKSYRGINACITYMSGYECPYWIGKKQAKELGLTLKDDQQYTPCFYAIFKGDEGQEEFKGIAFHQIYNMHQFVEGEALRPVVRTEKTFEPIAKAAEIVQGMKHRPEIKHEKAMCYYSPRLDYVNMARPETFDKPEMYYSVLFHELGHATGHESRLGRKQESGYEPSRFGSANYSREELVAEFTAAFLSAECGIVNETIDDSASYIKGWSEKLTQNPAWLYQACQQAQKAADYILDVRA